MPTAVIADYLEAVYNLTMEGEPVIAARLVERFGVSAPTVSDTLKRLQRDGLAEVLPSRHVILTAKGRSAAEAIIRRHRLSERFLVQELGMDWCQAHEEAHNFQRALSPAVEARIVGILGDPDTCPHGNPIPRAGRDPLQYLTQMGAVRLSAINGGEMVEVVCVSEVVEDESELLRYLDDRSIQPGRVLTAIEKTPLSGAFNVRVGEGESGDSVVIDPKVADLIWVRHTDARPIRAEVVGAPDEVPRFGAA